MRRASGSLPEVHLLDRHVCDWGGFGHVAVSLDGIAAIVENGIPCDQAVLLTGQDFPLKSNDEIKARLGRLAGFVPVVVPGPGQRGMAARRRLDRIDRRYFVRGRSLQVPSTRGQEGSARP